jgi:riboflavin biosynthesis pyrimidine reductase
MRLLLPEPAGPVTVEDAYRSSLADGADTDRPWIGLSMVASIDGSTVVDGRSERLSSQTDADVLHQLRSIADVILVGAGTVRGEGYGPPKKPGQRIAVVTRSGRIDVTSPLFTSGAGVVVTTEDATIAGDVDVVRAGADTVDLTAAVAELASLSDDTRFIQAEGGAHLNGALADDDLLDEINLTTSPGTVGGSGPRLTNGAEDHLHRFELVQLAVDDDSFLFSRWRRS